MDLKGKTILITGASSGIGRATALLCAREGANLVLGARREALLDDVVVKIGESGRAVRLAGNVADAAYNKALVDLALAEFGRLDGAFNNAGTVGAMGPIPDMEPASWDDVIAVNLTAAFHAARYQIPAMEKGSIVFTSSFVGNGIGLPGMGAYAAAKAGLVGLTQVLAVEYGGQGIRVNALLPGGTLTDMAGDDPAFHEWAAGLHVLKRMAQPEEIAEAAMFLLSDRASFVTGSAFYADGGNAIAKG